jgi:thiol:disulfide interchange protein DsbC
MSLTKKIGVTSAFIFSSLLLLNAIDNREQLDQTNMKQRLKTDKPKLVLQNNSNEPLVESEKMVKADAMPIKTVKSAIEAKLPGIEISHIEQSPIANYYQAFFNNEMIYVSADGRFIFTGNLIELSEQAPINHTQAAIANRDARQAPMRAETIAQLDESDMVVFKATNEKHVITIFTDVDCAYCRKLHKEMPQLNAAGITVRYLAYPRAGLGSTAHKKLVSIWCSPNKQAAMNEAKLNRKFSDITCQNPLDQHFNLTRKFNLSGTPSLILEDGELIGGYLPVDDLVAHLERKAGS